MDDLYGPPLPPGFKLSSEKKNDIQVPKPTSISTSTSKIIGPQLPDFLCQSKSDVNFASAESNNKSTVCVGPELPQCFNNNYSDSEDDQSYGPMPSQSKKSGYDVVKDIEKRASSMKNILDTKNQPRNEKLEREEWMVVPDTSRKNQLGIISSCLAPGSKPSSSKEKHSHHKSEKDRKTTAELKKYNKSKRSESLLEMHKKEKKRKKKEDSDKPKERKAFDRDEIAVRHFTKQQVNSVIDKAKFLNKRFHAGAEQYL